MPAAPHDLPLIAGRELELGPPRLEPVPPRAPDAAGIRSACAVALHMHQPLIPAGGDDLTRARLISNLEYMRDHPHEPDNHNYAAFHACYRRPGELIAQLVEEGKEPRLMLEYSGTLLEGLRRLGADDVFGELSRITHPGPYHHCVEWLGTAWGHAVAPSTPVQDFRHHVLAWRHHFAQLFGLEALRRVHGFSPPEMALPNHPDVAYAFVRTLLDAGYQWVLVQEHTVELPETGRGSERPHVPHRLVCKSSSGEAASIVAIIKTRGSDTKLVGHMQPYYEAKGLQRVLLQGKSVPELVTQIADGENGGVMMNEFPGKYCAVAREASGTETRLLGVSEYLELLRTAGVDLERLPEVQPIHQKRVWERCPPGAGPERLARVIEELRAEGNGFHMEGGSWTSDISWVRGYEGLLDEMQQVSALFHQRATLRNVAPSEPRYQNALFHLLCSQTSCYRYWGQGRWTEYGRELCRRTREILLHDF